MKKILILNLTRLGDLIQTTPLMEGLKRENPDCEITLLGNVNFVGICEQLPFIDRLEVFDVKRFIHADNGHTSYLDVYRYLDSLVKELRAEKFDMLLNLTHSKLSGMISGMLGVKDVRGFCATPDGRRIVNDPWLRYFSSFIDFRRYSSFNLVDIYQLGGGISPNGSRLSINDEKPALAAGALLEKLGIGDGDRLIGIQAGASMKERRWPPEKFGAAADIISEKREAKVLLFGGPSEEELGRKVESHMKRQAVNLVGKTSLTELVGLVKRCELLVTNDTATMHIAAAVGTPVVALFFVHAYAAETGPYSEGNIVIEPEISCFPCRHKAVCPHYACFDLLSPRDVADAAELLPQAAEKNGFFVSENRFPNLRLYRTCFDDLGFFDMRPLKKSALSEKDLFSRIYRYLFLKESFSGLEPAYWMDYLDDNFIPWDEDGRADWVEKKRLHFQELAAAAAEAVKLLNSMNKDYRNGKIDRFKRGGAKLGEIDKKIELLAHAHEELMPLVSLFERGKENVTDAPLEIMLARTRPLYMALQDSARFVRRMLAEWGAGKVAARNV
jgi:lipopolysaccharide heptosyltransferase II